MPIDWPAARQLMLTANDTFRATSWGSECCLEATLASDQAETAQRCLRALYQGLQWSSKYQTRLQLAPAAAAAQHFLIDDEHVIGIFRDCFAAAGSGGRYPDSLEEYLSIQRDGQRLMVADVMLEKQSRRLVNRWGKAQQSKFLRDVVFPGFTGILAHYTGLFEALDREDYLDGLQGMGLPAGTEQAIAIADCSGLLTRQLLFDVLYDIEKANRFLAETPPLALVYNADSPFNIEITQTGQLLPLGSGLRSAGAHLGRDGGLS